MIENGQKTNILVLVGLLLTTAPQLTANDPLQNDTDTVAATASPSLISPELKKMIVPVAALLVVFSGGGALGWHLNKSKSGMGSGQGTTTRSRSTNTIRHSSSNSRRVTDIQGVTSGNDKQRPSKTVASPPRSTYDPLSAPLPGGTSSSSPASGGTQSEAPPSPPFDGGLPPPPPPMDGPLPPPPPMDGPPPPPLIDPVTVTKTWGSTKDAPKSDAQNQSTNKGSVDLVQALASSGGRNSLKPTRERARTPSAEASQGNEGEGINIHTIIAARAQQPKDEELTSLNSQIQNIPPAKKNEKFKEARNKILGIKNDLTAKKEAMRKLIAAANNDSLVDRQAAYEKLAQ